MFSRLIRPTCNSFLRSKLNLPKFNKIILHPFSTRSNFRIRKTHNEACEIQKCNKCDCAICNCVTCNNVRKYNCSPIWMCKNSCTCNLNDTYKHLNCNCDTCTNLDVKYNNNNSKQSKTKEETKKENGGCDISFFGFFGIVGLLIGGGHLVNYVSIEYYIVKQDVAENTKRIDKLEKK